MADGGFQALDLTWGDPTAPGLRLQAIDHRYHDARCVCGHVTRAAPGTGAVADPALSGTRLGAWRLVGPGLATLIVALPLRFRLSRRRRRVFLHDWLGVTLSVGVLDDTRREAGAAAAPLEDARIAAVAASALLHVDETSWPQSDRSLWRWVFVSATVTRFAVAGRGRELLDRVLPGFVGWLMSDGWSADRHLTRRLRCWAHLTRTAQGLIDSDDREAQAFGRLVQTAFETLIAAIHAARAGPPVDPPQVHAELLDTLREASGALLGHRHPKTRALAVELWNDWDTGSAPINRILYQNLI